METLPIASSAKAVRHMFLRDMVLIASIGVHPHEHAAPQRVRINVDLGVEDDGARPLSRTPVGRDELARVVDYEKLADRVRATQRGAGGCAVARPPWRRKETDFELAIRRPHNTDRGGGAH